MTKVLFLLSAVVMAVAGVFSYQNREVFIKTRLDRQANDQKINAELTKLETLANEIGEVRSKAATTVAEVTGEQERLDQAKIRLRNAEAEASRAGEELEANQKKIQEYRAKITSMPPGVTLETINEDINKLKTAIAENKTKVEQIQEEMVQKEGDVKKVQNELNSFNRRIEERRKSFDRNSMSATITAVNNDWGFVVINAGKNIGITEDTKLIVTRGTQSLGKLNIVAVEGNNTIASILPESIRQDLVISPGDKVILETLHQ